MPVSFVTIEQRDNYGCYRGAPSADELSRRFHLDDTDLAWVSQKRGEHNRLGVALQLTTVRFLGAFLDDPTAVPQPVIDRMAEQLDITNINCLAAYRKSKWRRVHAVEIRRQYGYYEFVDSFVGFRLTRWLYTLCWTGTERPSVLFDRTRTWLLTHKILLPGISVLERFIAKLRSRVESRLWYLLGQGICVEQQAKLESLLVLAEGSRTSLLERLRKGPVTVSAPSLVRAVLRLQEIRELGIKLPATTIPPGRMAALARFAATAKVTTLRRLPPTRRLATLVAFVLSLEAAAYDDVLDVLSLLLKDMFNQAKKEDKKTRERTLKDLDQARPVQKNPRFCRVKFIQFLTLFHS